MCKDIVIILKHVKLATSSILYSDFNNLIQAFVQ